MRDKLLLAGAAAALLALPAMAQNTAAPPAVPPASSATGSATAAPGPNMPPPVNPAPTVPPGSTPSSDASASSDAASTGTATNTSATAADLRTGATVRDSAGADVGRISKVTKGKTDAETMVTLSSGGKTVTVPASSLSLSAGALVTGQTKADIWAPK